MSTTQIFLLTDLEGSTRLWNQFPEAMETALARHDELIRAAVESANGQIVKTTGDGFLAVFGSVGDGVSACVRAQRSLIEESWEETGPLRVRMGLHIGKAQQRGGDYFGTTVNRAARLMAAAHGGQVLLSAAIARLVAEQLPENVSMRDLGMHQLKDLPHPERIFQLMHPDLPVEFAEVASESVSQIRISILGPPTMTIDGEPLTINRLQFRALIYRLSAQASPVPRESLAFLFWPDVPDSKARRNLTQLLSHVRRTLPDPDLLVVSSEHVSLDYNCVWSDAATFEQVCTSPDQHDRHQLGQAVALYRDTLLAGVSLPDNPEYESWLSGERYRFERIYLDTLDRLLDDHIEHGENDEAVDFARRYLEVDELAEDVHRRLMECHLANGDRSAALTQYERCTAVLERELGVKPLPETEAVYQAILVGKQQEEQRAAPELVWSTLPGLDVPMVGRDHLLQQMTTAFRRAQTGQGQVILLAGEAGIGKSRLLQEFAGELQASAKILVGACNASIQSIPYQPIVEAIRPHLLQSDTWRSIGGAWLREASLLFPELAQFSSAEWGRNPGSDPQQARGRLFEALHLIVEGLAAPSMPVVLCLDDLQWADATTIDWLIYMMQKMRRSRLLVAGTYRTEEPDAVVSLCRELSRSRFGLELRIPRLDCDHVAQILEHAAIEGDAELAAALCQTTGGNPFFLLEIARGLTESGQTTGRIQTSNLPIPDTIHETVQHRLDRLQPVARQILEASAVWGTAFDFDSIRATAGRSEMETADGLDELVAHQVLAEDGSLLRFRHELLRSVVYQDLSDWRRRLLHRRAAEVLEGALRHCQEFERPSLVTHAGRHFALANEADRAVGYLLEAGDHARNVYDDGAALAQYEQALEFLRRGDDHGKTARTLMKIGLTHHNALDFPASNVAFEEGFRFFRLASTVPVTSTLPAAPHPLRVVDFAPSLPTVDPVLADEFHARAVLGHLFAGLVSLSPDLGVAPDVAERWSVLENGRTYVFHLRRDVTWSDGAPVTAHDFEHTWRRVLDPQTNSLHASLLYDIRGACAYHQQENSEPTSVGIHAPDPATLVVELEEPAGYFLHVLTDVVAFPTPRDLVEKHGAEWTNVDRIATNGPFTLSRVVDDHSIHLKRNPLYHGTFEGNIDEVIFHPRGDWPARLEQYCAGEIDVLSLFYPPSPEMRRARQRLASDYISHPTATTDFIYFNTKQPPLDDVRVRQALAAALDKEALAEIIMEGYVSPATGGLVPPAIPGHTASNPLPFDAGHARALLADSGLSHYALNLELTIPESFERVGEFLQAQWRDHLGIRVAVNVLDWSSFVDCMTTTLPPISVFGWRGNYPDPDAFLGKGPGQTFGGWDDEIYEWLWTQAKQTLNQQERLDLYRQMDRMLVEEAAIIPLAYSRDHLLVKPWVTRFPVSSLIHSYWKGAVIEPHE